MKRHEDNLSNRHGNTIIPEAITILVSYSPKMAAAKAAMETAARKQVEKGLPANQPAIIAVQSQIWYETILIPPGFDESSIQKLSDVERYGGKLISRLAQ